MRKIVLAIAIALISVSAYAITLKTIEPGKQYDMVEATTLLKTALNSFPTGTVFVSDSVKKNKSELQKDLGLVIVPDGSFAYDDDWYVYVVAPTIWGTYIVYSFSGISLK